MINFRYYDLKSDFLTDLNKYLLDKNKTILLFPTNISKNIAKQKYQPKWNFRDNLFLTMTEFKNELFITDKPVLKEDKRTLLFYDSLSAEDKEKLGFKNYFQAIDTIQKFFEFWNELNEELVDLEEIESILIPEANENNWQQRIISDFIKYKKQYFAYITKHVFSDKIFVNNLNHVDTFKFDNYERIIIVNQYYFTKLEKRILKERFANKDIDLIYQLPNGYVDEKNWEIKQEISAKEIDNKIDITVVQAPNEYSMINHLISVLDKEDFKTIIDFRFEEKYYSKYFLPAKFKFNTQMSFQQTSILKFLKNITDFISSFKYINREILIPITSFLKILRNREFCYYFLENDERDYIKEETINYLLKLQQDEYKFMDFKGLFFKSGALPCIRNFFDRIKVFLNKIFEIRNLTNFIKFLYQPSHILLDKIITNKEKKFTNLIEIYYNALGDLKTVEEVMINKNWDDYFSFNKTHTNGISYAVNFLNFVIAYLKPKTLSFNQKDDSGKIRVTNLANTRNLTYKNLIFLNIIEKVLPSSARMPFIFSENQRKKLGLLTYDKIRERDKYYFYRLISLSGKTKLYTIQNENDNIEISSFIEELNFKLENIKWKIIENQNIKNNVKAIFNPENYQVDKDIVRNIDFYNIPLKLETDLKDRNLYLSFSSWKTFQKNPFQYYFDKILKLENDLQESNEDYSHLFIGNFVHYLLNSLFERYNEKENVSLENLVTNYLPKLFERFMQKNFLKKTHNYADFYFEKITFPLIIEGIENFVKQLEPNFLKESINNLSILPETEKLQSKAISMEADINLNLVGKADLRIEGDQAFIFDYKTGNSSRSAYYKEQLFIYKLIYYLIEKKYEEENVKAYLYYVYDNKFYPYSVNAENKLKKEFSQFLGKVKKQVKEVLERGFFIGEKAYIYEDKDLIRRDLFSIHKNSILNKGADNE